MGFFKRITATISSGMDQAITKVENHDAIIAAAIKNTQTSAARARVRLARVQRDGKALRQRVQHLENAQVDWTRRAKAVAHSDKDRALECVKRLKSAKQQLEQTRANLKQHEELEKQVQETLQKIQSRLGEMNQQRNMMRSRESVAEAMRVINNLDGATNSDIEETFDRWEVLISESEIVGSNVDVRDSLTIDFLQSEDQEELEAELNDLLNEDNDNDTH